MSDNRDAKITASWSLGQAYAKHGKVDAKTVQDAKKLIDELPEMIIYVESKDLPDTPASEASIKYLKSTIMQYAKGWIKGHNVDMAISSLVGDNPTQSDVSAAIDKIKEDKSVDHEQLVDRSERDYGPPQKREDDEQPHPSEQK